MSWAVDSYGFMQLSPFVRCNSHWVRDFFPVDDAETLKDANRTGAYKHQPIIKVLPNYTERELSAWYTEREAQKRERIASRKYARLERAERDFERRVMWQRSQPRPPREKEYLTQRPWPSTCPFSTRRTLNIHPHETGISSRLHASPLGPSLHYYAENSSLGALLRTLALPCSITTMSSILTPPHSER